MKLLESEFFKNSFIKKTSEKKFSNLSFTLQVYFDLCYFRGWKGVRIFYSRKKQNFFVLAINPKKNQQLEIFFPYKSNFKINFLNLFDLFQFFISKKKLYLRFFNIALVEQDSTITYYRVVSNFSKASGPIGK
ncbi:hypothetical protein HAN_2g237 (nucleomorph) [Hemiselmis andersenii]|uniref:tRNA-splicing endonuclease subunit Sen15 domain-containing protein n=1 Tax=Hemiselmis andersenii TaxID=464988 RepID=A9BKQ8_HEMAN|nr:hypothetical protein HAN_2g237 [Hemiselmis andersenii]ABW98063.1 hypothetical protein HAN_2g237 [Hemiselmis andersenii]